MYPNNGVTMSRIAKQPIIIPENVKIKYDHPNITIKGNIDTITLTINNAVNINIIDNKLICNIHKDHPNAWSHAGTARSIINSIIIGVTKGFSKKILLHGVGYRATIKNNQILLTLGYSHQITYILPNTITAECISQNEIIIKGADKQKVTQIAAEIRHYKPTDPYKNKGIRYENEIIRTKEVKKK
uniref:50S ribosomal protein L6 n=1 Tax=Candidatus Aschnera chinzeii TaxID=1485666 RepID=A0AAT9G469_9ENTR|nr:MAG: 50S ribosomal protein L6 [Candidatus Aschnera chinzeii]